MLTTKATRPRTWVQNVMSLPPGDPVSTNRVEVCRENSNLIDTDVFHADDGAYECVVFAVYFFSFCLVVFTALTSQLLFSIHLYFEHCGQNGRLLCVILTTLRVLKFLIVKLCASFSIYAIILHGRTKLSSCEAIFLFC